MKTSAKLATGLSAAVIAGLIAFAVVPMLSAPSAEPVAAPTAPAKQEAAPVAEADPVPVPTSTAVDCAAAPTARINVPNYAYNTREVTEAELVGVLSDGGPRDMAIGSPTLVDGEPVAYTVQPGDALDVIAERFCIDRLSFGHYNDTFGWDLQPGDVLVLRPDAEPL